MIPTLATERLTLRPMRFEDFEPYADFLASSRARWMKGPHDRQTAWAWFSSDIAHWPLFGYGALMIEVEGASAGQVAITHGITFPEHELGWFLFEGYEGHGYATEAAAALRAYGYGECGLRTLVSYCAAENTGSVAVATRLGAVHDPDAPRPEGDNCRVYRHPAPEALQ